MIIYHLPVWVNAKKGAASRDWRSCRPEWRPPGRRGSCLRCWRSGCSRRRACPSPASGTRARSPAPAPAGRSELAGITSRPARSRRRANSTARSGVPDVGIPRRYAAAPLLRLVRLIRHDATRSSWRAGTQPGASRSSAWGRFSPARGWPSAAAGRRPAGAVCAFGDRVVQQHRERLDGARIGCRRIVDRIFHHRPILRLERKVPTYRLEGSPPARASAGLPGWSGPVGRCAVSDCRPIALPRSS